MKKIEIFTSDLDTVIDSYVAMGKTTYKVALDDLYPLINRFEAQRKLQDKKFYKRLQTDIVGGCIMPPITIAFIDKEENNLSEVSDFENFINRNLEFGYILDGMQRLNTLKSASEDEDFDYNRIAYLNIIVANNQDKLLYRMITLNNGQKPMTPRHQIEILTSEMFDFNNLKNISVQTEKSRAEKSIRGSFNLGDISRGYLAFLTNNVNNENNKIIDEKMDEILVTRILDNRESTQELSFQKILKLIDKLSEDTEIKQWFGVNNNLIGFCVGIKNSYDNLKHITPEEFLSSIIIFDKAFNSINASKVNLGKYRRQLSNEFIKEYEKLSIMDEDELIEHFMEVTS
ncbi:hypothetical protein [Alcaligenes endophyticus]|uniref:DUF262 domain-containing protein n=1 Tax=Alcaligenes endophyticus TaxID=1929088 RepID=A0ABT8EKC6_9BURK|nr:hypothetical protein [Alcaligenes endophyticus]MCX5590898.1 hypothetical protein [Alcaligenes endophyticus]MDN4121740.1 hypothetical protein [Alcaligenes endophyticus]